MVIHILLSVCFAGIAAILAVRAWKLVVRSRTGGEAGRMRRGARLPRWATSLPVCAVVALICAVLALAAARTGKHWMRNGHGAWQQHRLTLELHLPAMVPGRMYTVVAKFHVRGKPYVSATPLKIRFGAQEPVYRVPLYYDVNNPARNGWVPLRAPILDEIDKILLLLMGAMVCLIFLLETERTRRVRRSVHTQTGKK